MRNIPVELVTRYEDAGWWTRESLGQVLAHGLQAAPDATFRVYSDVRPWSGTFGDVELVARRLAAGLRARGVGAGDVVAFQLPNWMEAAATFWASAFLGAALVPIVHFYGRKELAHILASAKPRVFITAEEFGRMTYQPDLCSDVPVVGLVGRAFDDDGWYHTGDIGVLDADGYLTITDRKADVIIRGGENISAVEVEEVLLGMPGIAEAVVVAAPDAGLGERVAAVLRLKPGHVLPTADDVREHFAGQGAARQKWPEVLLEVADYPRTPSGKVHKRLVRAGIAVASG
jgi:acyl-CoA synthetase (AMP-forming)/AMP-acid ligase II